MPSTVSAVPKPVSPLTMPPATAPAKTIAICTDPIESTAQRDHLAAIGDDGGAGDEAAGVGDQKQQRPVKIALLAETADRNFALELGATFALQIIAVELGDNPTRGDGVDADAFEGKLERQCLGQLDHAGLGGCIGDDA